MGEAAARIAFARQRHRDANRVEQNRNNGNNTGSRFRNIALSASGNNAGSRFRNVALSASASSVDGKRTLVTDPELAAVLSKKQNKKQTEKSDSSWFDRFKRIHTRKLSNYLFSTDTEYKFSAPKGHHELFFDGGTKFKKEKHMTKTEKLRQYKYFGKVPFSIIIIGK